MDAVQLIHVLGSAGLSVALTPDDSLRVTPATALNDELRRVIRAGKSALVQYLQHAAANDSTPDPDRWCWPHSTAMNTAEIDTFTMRLARFTDMGMTHDDAEGLADRLVYRDREMDDRAVCLECVHLHRFGRCGNWRQSGVAIQARDAQLAPEFATMLQRCDGYKGV